MMACAELLAVCLLSADRGPAARHQPLPIFHDIFRRADKNDDGKLSFEEFKNYFADGILSSEELWELFSGIDRRHSDNVDTEKLCDYFSAYLGEYRNVLSALEALNTAVLAAMDKTKLRYETSSKMEQFLIRFLLRETMHQLQSLQASLECAVDTVEEQAGRERKDIKKSETSVGLRSGRRCGRRGQKNVCLSPTDPYSGMLTTGVCVEDNSQWMAQINRLQQLIEKLECKSPRLEPLKEEAVCKGRDAHILVAKRQISVATSSIEEFRQAFRSYTEVTAGQSSCLHVSACKLTDEACFILYEFWRDVTSWRRLEAFLVWGWVCMLWWRGGGWKGFPLRAPPGPPWLPLLAQLVLLLTAQPSVPPGPFAAGGGGHPDKGFGEQGRSECPSLGGAKAALSPVHGQGSWRTAALLQL
ncbi:N-terminal EF-hand calcium-binding protein 3 isoform X2 [Accipiter gentilis]|uniref:N-terminal EF-hand calcium-binding protein 3 isoform X2 n=1 Tax=Astur gentilis TaxID=8957 RepID=UPI002110863F|nr:N-terminal EF-hand calcium-binding protein 3 isoform X2 [Accipiter gentilis]